MGILSTLVKACFLALALTAWQLFLQPLYNEWIQMQGRAVGFGETMLGYVVVILVAWTLAALVMRTLGGGDKD
jgi:hypothetical protein